MKSKLGYKKGSPYLDEEEIVINSNHITTKDMAFPIMANGIPLFPDTGDYVFEGTDKVVEKPIMQSAGTFYSSMKDELSNADKAMDERVTDIFNIGNAGQGFKFGDDPSAARKTDSKKFNPNFIPALGVTNLALNKFSEFMKRKELEKEYMRMQTLSNIPETTKLTDTSRYGNPYIMQEGGRLVTEVPQGYTPLKTEGNRSYFQMTRTINPAQKGQKSSGEEYNNFLMKQLQSGISPEELANKGYISNSNIDTFKPFYKKDIVYTETVPQQVVEPTPAFRGEPIYENNKLIGYSRYNSRNSTSQSDPGTLNTGYQDTEFMFADDMGKPTGDLYNIPSSDWYGYVGTTNQLKTREGLDKYKSSLVKKFKKGGKMQLGGISSSDLSSETITSSFDFNISQPSISSENESNVSSPETSDFKKAIIMKESSGNYQALPKKKDGTLASSAVGAYQFLWNKHKNEIKKVTGVSSKEDFRKNPQAQDTYFDYWDATILTPTALTIQKVLGNKAPDLNTIKSKVHFAGPKGAKDYFFKGVETKDAFGTTTSKYKEGGEYEMNPEQLLQFLKHGGEVEYIIE
jgi:hypothetical protein